MYEEPSSALTLTKTDSQGDPLWEKTFGRDIGAFGWRVRETIDGGIIAAGVLSPEGYGTGPIYVVRTDGEGNSLWEQTFGRSDPYDLGLGLLSLPDGGFVIAGEKLSKLDSAGNLLWERDITGQMTDIQPTADGGFASVGARARAGDQGSSDMLLVKTDSDGITEWETTFEGDRHTYGLSLLQTSDGGFLLSGGRETFGYYDDSYIVRTDSEGTVLWEKIFLWLPAQKIVETTDGGIVFVGSDWDGVDGYWTEGSHLLRLDGDGNFEWHVELETAIRDLQETPDGGFILAGFHWTGGYWQDGYLAKTDSGGNLVWDRAYGGGDEDDVFISVEQTADGGFALAGSLMSWPYFF